MTNIKSAPSLAAGLCAAAGTYWVCMQLSLRGLTAVPTSRNARAIDVLVSTPDGAHTASLQVKTAQTMVKFWPTPASRHIIPSDSFWYVFLRWDKARRDFEAFLVSSYDVKHGVEIEEERLRQRNAQPFPAWNLRDAPASPEELRQAWDTWSPDGVARRSLI